MLALFVALVLTCTVAAPRAYAGPLEDIGGFFSNVGNSIVSLLGIDTESNGVEVYAVEDSAVSVSDPDTTNSWQNHTAPGGTVSTQNVGRIWTDKSVFTKDYIFSGSGAVDSVEKGDADFLVALSALSSTSNLKTTTTSTTPLDIVLVLDVSGSMDDSMGMTYTYTEVYPRSNQETYYIQVNGAWQEVEYFEPGWWESGSEGWRYRSGGSLFDPQYTYVEPKTSAADNDPDHIQFYSRGRGQSVDKIDALKNAANQFISSVGELNQNVTDDNDLSRIAIVKYADDTYHYSIGNNRNAPGGSNYNYTQVVSDFSSNTDELENDINSLRAGGATSADYGLTMAQNVLNGGHYEAEWYSDNEGEGTYVGARDDAQKVVIFFTDGEPNHSSGFSGSVAAESVNIAHDIKGAGTTIYTIGVVNGADPNEDPTAQDASNINKYLHAVSSNYKEATAENNQGNASWNNLELGPRMQDGDGGNANYYFAANDADELDQVFEDITSSITKDASSGSPIEEEEHEGALNPGTLTFADTLGSYMTVSGDTMTVVYGDQPFTSTNKTTSGNVDTYHFEGTVAGNGVYKEGDLSTLTVTVTHGDDAAGDTVTAEIPASLLPMRNYDVDTNAGTMTVTPAYPIRLFFGVSVKQDAKDVIEQGYGDAYDAIVASNGTDDGQVAFYSNLFTIGAGDTAVTFSPSDGNKFYYYTSDTPLYIDEACTRPATRNNSAGAVTLYYSEPYWAATGQGDGAEEMTQGIAISVGDKDWNSIEYREGYNGAAYIPAGTKRLDRPATLNAAKTDNTTQTAGSVLTPSWNGNQVVQHLGNNGKVTYELPGILEIKKNVDWGNASEETKQNQNSFSFTVDFNGDETLGGEFLYDVYGAGADPVRTGTVTDGGTITLEANQRVVIKALPNGTTFTLTETEANKGGFTTTDANPSDPQNNTTDGVVSGTIVGGGQRSASFQNSYMADEPVNLNAKTPLKVQKKLEGRDWRASDSFFFKITAIDQGPVMSEPTTVQITEQTDQQTATFGDITFNAAGEYRFRVQELSDTEDGITPIAGIDYSGAIYRVTVKVSDAGQGNLKIESVTIEQMTNDQGNQGSGVIQDDTMLFTNTYVSGQTTETLQGTKVYTDKSGGNPIDAGKFAFQIEALGGYETGTVEGDATADDYTIAADSDAMPKPGGMTGTTLETGNVGNLFQFPQIVFDGNDVGKTFEYRITELPRQYQGDAEKGMTYDTTNSYVVKIVVSEQDDPDSDEPKVEIVAEPSLQPSQIVFENTYEPTPATTDATGEGAIEGSKVIDGRNLKNGEVFYFTLTQGTITNAANDTTWADVLDAEGNPVAAAHTVSVNDPANLDFAFAPMTFNKVGTYAFTLTETDVSGNSLPATDGQGLTYSTESYTVTVTVTDQHDGTLDAAVSYTKMGAEAEEAVFTNVYEADMNYGAGGKGGINVTKTMAGGRPMAADEFEFTLAGEGPAGDVNEGFKNTAAPTGGTVTMAQLQSLTFDQDDAGKTFTFTVDEVDGNLDGVTYDQSQYRVEIAVFDNGDGTMHTETTVTKKMNADGSEADEIVIDKANSDAADYQVPTFGFTNSYDPTSITTSDDTKTTLQVAKTVTGAPSPDGVNYSFTLTPADDNPAPVQGDADAFNATTNGVIAANKSQTVSFGELTFTKAGKYTFTVNEVAPDARPGWTYDTTGKTIAVEVVGYNPETGEYDGQLHIADVTDNPAKVTNDYQPGTVIVGGDGAKDQIAVQKTVTGYATDADFTFQLQPIDPNDSKWDNVERVDDTWNGTTTITELFDTNSTKTVNMGALKFGATGEYKFTVTEVGAADFNGGDNRAGWTYDEHTATVTVKVTDDNFDGQLDAEVTYDNTGATTETDKAVDNAAAFTNKYEAAAATLTGEDGFKGTKTIDGRNGLNSETFGFTLSKGFVFDDGDWDAVTFQPTNGDAAAFDTAAATATMHTDGASADFWFDGTFTFAQAGVYTFNVEETGHNNSNGLPNDGANGMTYDRHVGTITVTVTDDGKGNLTAAAAAGTVTEGDGENDVTFENVYQPTPATYGEGAALLGGHKYINDTSGSYKLQPNTFDFIIRAQQAGNPMPDGAEPSTDEKGRSVVTVKNAQDSGDVYDFGTITFTHEDMVGATDKGNGIFTKEFQYNIFEGATSLPGISKDNSAYTVTFKVTENQNDGTMTVEASAVKIVDGGDDNLDNDGDQTLAYMDKLDFVNTYDPQEIKGYQNIFKTLSGRNWRDGDTFTFDIAMTATELDGTTPLAVDTVMVSDNGTSATLSEVQSTNDGHGLSYTATIEPHSSQTGNTYRFSTGEITYTHVGIYTWTVSEQDSTVQGVTSDDMTYTVTATITDENGVLKREVKIEPATTDHGGQIGDTLDFTNVYNTTGVLDPNGDEAIKVTKEFTGRENDQWLEGDSFKVMLTAQDSVVGGTTGLPAAEVPMPDGRTGGVATIDLTADAHEDVAFGAITYTRPGTYNYVLTEVQEAALEGVSYSLAKYQVTVTATDNGDGTMDVTSKIQQVVGDEGDTFSPLKDVDEATFVNTYRPNFAMLDGSVHLRVVKSLEGRDWYNTDRWTFTLAPADTATTEAVEVSHTVIMPPFVNLDITAASEDFAINFGDITFKEPGTYTFTVTESGSVNGVTNDADPERTIVVNVVDDTKGHLVASIDADKSDRLTFTNTYSPNEVVVGEDAGNALTVQKMLSGRAWADDEAYSFTLAPVDDEADNPMPEGDGANVVTLGKPADGSVNNGVFGDITFTEAGTYHYTITENVPQEGSADRDASMDYDTHVTKVTVAVFEDQADGELWAEISYDNSAATNASDQVVTDAAAFTNTDKLEATLDLTGTKVLKGRDFQDGDNFTFTVTADDNAPLPDGVDEDGNVTINPTEGPEAAIDFGAITFTEDGEYIYHIAEVQGGASDMTYDTASRVLIVTVTDDGRGNLNAEITMGSDQLTWTNEWNGQEGTASPLVGTKVLTGTELKNSQFTFIVEPQDGAPMGDTLRANFNGDATEGEGGSWSAPITLLNSITYTESGEYTYLITEVNDGQPGITYDATQFRVTNTVAEDGRITTKIEKFENGENWTEAEAVVFQNSYKTEGSAVLDGSANLTGTKTLKGRDWNDTDSFTFILAAGNNETQAAIDAENIVMPDTMEVVQGNYSDGAQVPFHFGNISFKKTGTYTFTISEQQPDSEGFVGNTDGMSYDDHVYTLTVEVKEEGGTLVAEVTKTEGEANWINTYKNDGDTTGTLTGANNLEVTKVISGRDWLDTDSFTFTLTGGDDATKQAIEDGKIMLPKNADGLTIDSGTEGHAAAFGDITFTEPGNYVFNIVETKGSISGMTYDTEVRIIEVSVMESFDQTPGAPALTVTSTVTSPAAGLTFTNVYSTHELPISISGTKVMQGRDFKEGDSFTFHINKSTNGIMPSNVDADGNITITPSNGSTCDIDFGSFTIDKPGDYTFSISEVEGDISGVTYDTDAKIITVHAKDNGTGGYDISLEGDLVWTNVYAADPTNLGLTGIKFIDGREFKAGDSFSFKIEPSEGAPMLSGADENGIVTIEPTSGKSWEIDFGTVKVDHAGTYEYKITEVEGNAAGMSYDTDPRTVTIKVADNGNGGWTIENISDLSNLQWTNSYTSTPTDPTDPTDPKPGDTDPWININKELVGRTLKDGEFEFTMALVGDSDAVSPKSITTTNIADGSVVFNKDGNEGFIFSEAGSYTFTIFEKVGAEDGMTYDRNIYTVRAVVEDNGDGKLEVTRWELLNADGSVVTENPSITFTNTFENEPVNPPITPEDPDPSDPSTPDTGIGKTISGRDLIAGEFIFAIETVKDYGDAVSPSRITATNNADGVIDFGDGFTFSEAGDYEFTISEVKGNATGVTYDETIYHATAHVTEQNGKLVVTWEVTDAAGNAVDSITFANEFQPGPTAEIVFGAKKILNGRELAAGEFTFELRDADGNVVATATNAADGSIVFSEPVEFTEPGVYTYTIAEVAGDLEGVTYDTAVFTATVTVVDNGDGTLTASVTYSGTGELPTFVNTYQTDVPVTPDEPGNPGEPGIPQTGDYALVTVGGVALAAVALIATGLYLRRRNSH